MDSLSDQDWMAVVVRTAAVLYDVPESHVRVVVEYSYDAAPVARWGVAVYGRDAPKPWLSRRGATLRVCLANIFDVCWERAGGRYLELGRMLRRPDGDWLTAALEDGPPTEGTP